jgi:hypothetical protein
MQSSFQSGLRQGRVRDHSIQKQNSSRLSRRRVFFTFMTWRQSLKNLMVSRRSFSART